MLVQASLDQLSTFAAYHAMGLEKDHRNYDNISQICYLLGITASWIVLTNNPGQGGMLSSPRVLWSQAPSRLNSSHRLSTWPI
jgi:hypothetical protein